jgi:cell division control protein 7
MTNVPTVDQPPASLTDLVLKLNPHLYTPPTSMPSPQEAEEHIIAMDDALDLCTRLLKLDATKRISAKRALNHPFFHNSEDFEEEIELPVLTGVEGKCGHLHSLADGKRELTSGGDTAHRYGMRRELTCTDHAWFYKDCQEMHFGQGIPTDETKCVSRRDKLHPWLCKRLTRQYAQNITTGNNEPS